MWGVGCGAWCLFRDVTMAVTEMPLTVTGVIIWIVTEVTEMTRAETSSETTLLTLP